MSDDKEIWEAKFTESIVGLMFRGARKNGRGPWLKYEELPGPVRSYLLLEVLPGAAGTVVIGDSELRTLDALEKAMESQGTDRFGQRRGLDAVIWVEVDKERQHHRRAVPPGTPAIRDLRDLMRFFGVDDVRRLNRAVYNGTQCGASISIRTPDEVWHHNGEDWSGITEITAFTIQTIVEGSDATVDSDPFELPVAIAEVDRWIEEMEAEARFLWNEANGPEEELADPSAFRPKPGPKDWSPLWTKPRGDR